MNSFSISELQQFSGIKAHTIRIWEQRYNALEPNRTEGNTRYYNGDQLRRLLNIVSLMESGNKVSELCVMSDQKLNTLLRQKLETTPPGDHNYEYFVSQIVAAAIEYNEAGFDKIFSNAILRFGLTETYRNILYPSLMRLGLMWSAEALRPAQEHFITGMFRQKILAAVDALPLPGSGATTWLLFLPEDEFHETGLLFANFLIRQAGHKVIYLGANLSLDSLKTAVKDTRPSSLLFFAVRRKDKQAFQHYISQLTKAIAEKKIFLACEPSMSKEIKHSKNLLLLHHVSDLEDQLK